ncbi:MAG: PaRep2b protein [Thermoproteus sp.]
MERLAQLFVEAITRVLAWADAHKAYLSLTAVMAGLIAPSAAVNLWGSIELGALAHAASLMPFIALGGVERSREEAFRLIKGAPDPYGKFLDMARAANAGRIGLAEPWESLRMLVRPTAEEREELARNRAYDKFRGNERRKKALFYAVLALEEALGIYRAASRCAGRLEESVQKEEVGEGPLRWAMYVADLKGLERLAKEEEKALDDALRALRERLNEYAVKYDLRDLLDVKEDAARELAEAERTALPKFSGVSLGVKAYAALMAYRERALGRRSIYGTAARYWLEEGGSAWLLYYAPETAYKNAGRAGAEAAATVEGMVAEALRRLFLRPGADRYSGLVEELTKGGKLALELEKGAEKGTETYLFRPLKLEGGKPVELGIKLKIEKMGEGAGIIYALMLDARWREFFGRELKMAEEAAEELRERWPVEDPFAYMLGWPASDVAIIGEGSARALEMGTSHLWQLAETHALFGWSDISVPRVNLTLEGPKPQFHARTSLEKLDEAVRRSAEGGWLKRLGTEAGSWDELKRQVAQRWDGVVEAAVRRLGGDVQKELEELKDKLNDDKVAREAIAPALLLIQAEKLGVNEESLRYFAAAISGAIGGDGHVSAALERVELASGSRAIALLWGAAFRAYGIEAKVRGIGRSAFQVVASGDDAVRLARLYFLFGPPLLEGGDERVINHKLDEAVELGAKGALDIRWEGLRRRTEDGPVTADLIISEGGADVKYNVYLRRDAIELQFNSTDRGRVELAARLLKLAGVSAEVKEKGGRDVWYVRATTDRLAAGRKELRDAVAGIVRKAAENGWVNSETADRWLDKLESGRVLKEGWPKYYVRLVEGTLEVRYASTDPEGIEREAQRLRAMGLVEGRHFTVKMPEGGGEGYVRILKDGLMRAAWLSVHGSGDQQRLAAEFVDLILERAEEKGGAVHEKALEVVKRGREVGSMRLAGFEKKVDGRLVKVLGGGAQFDEGKGGRTLLRIKITAEVDGVRGDYTITFGRRGRDNAAVGRAYIREEADAERLAALIKALTGKEPRVYRVGNKIMIECGREHLEGFMRYTELADAIARWLEGTSRR